MSSMSNVEVLHDKGVDRVLGAIASTPHSTDAIAAQLYDACRKIAGVKSINVEPRWHSKGDGLVPERSWLVYLSDRQEPSASGCGVKSDPWDAFKAARFDYNRKRRENEVRVRVTREVEARIAQEAQQADAHNPEPLVLMGPGGDFRSAIHEDGRKIVIEPDRPEEIEEAEEEHHPSERCTPSGHPSREQ